MNSPYARLLGWSVENFMSIEKGSVEFDDTNIINFKGYNDSGKSAMLTALKVLMTNCNPSKQVNFIQDDKEYFRVVARFEDGVTILRDKYVNGQSLYEMYKDGQLLYSTKQGKTLTRVSEVPQPIADYLGLIIYDDTCINARSCFEKQIGVQTTGSENYKMFNTVLKSEELAAASTMINNDRNRLASDIAAADTKLGVLKGMYKPGVTKEMVDWLKEEDGAVDKCDLRLSALSSIESTEQSIQSVQIPPYIEQIEADRLSDINRISGISSSLSEISVPPQLEGIDSERISMISSIYGISKQLEGCDVPPQIEGFDADKIMELHNLVSLVNDVKKLQKMISDSEEEAQLLTQELDDCRSKAEDYGVKMIKCPGCGLVFASGEEHRHG